MPSYICRPLANKSLIRDIYTLTLELDTCFWNFDSSICTLDDISLSICSVQVSFEPNNYNLDSRTKADKGNIRNFLNDCCEDCMIAIFECWKNNFKIIWIALKFALVGLGNNNFGGGNNLTWAQLRYKQSDTIFQVNTLKNFRVEQSFGAAELVFVVSLNGKQIDIYVQKIGMYCILIIANFYLFQLVSGIWIIEQWSNFCFSVHILQIFATHILQMFIQIMFLSFYVSNSDSVL